MNLEELTALRAHIVASTAASLAGPTVAAQGILSDGVVCNLIIADLNTAKNLITQLRFAHSPNLNPPILVFIWIQGKYH